jgi:hypothetical protein
LNVQQQNMYGAMWLWLLGQLIDLEASLNFSVVSSLSTC